jgi:hypothetical protein
MKIKGKPLTGDTIDSFFVEKAVGEGGTLFMCADGRIQVRRSFWADYFIMSSFRLPPFSRMIWVFTVRDNLFSEALQEVLRSTGSLVEPNDVFYHPYANGIALKRRANSVIFLDTEVDMSVIAHECGHVALYAMEDAEVEVHGGSSEMFCYTLDYLFKNVSELHEYHKKLIK